MTTTTGVLGDFSDIPRHPKPVGTFVSMYAGAGGLDLGFALAGFRPVWSSEISAAAQVTNVTGFGLLSGLLPHLGQACVHTGDLLEVPEQDMPKAGVADLVIGGPPCQGFSQAGRMDPDDPRSQHVHRFFDMVGRVRPAVFVMENVKALLVNGRHAAVRDELLARADRLGYRTEWVCLNAADFGVPQARERAFLIGSRFGTPKVPEPTTAGVPFTVRDALGTLPPWGTAGNHQLCTAKVTLAKNPVLRQSPYAGMVFNGAGRPLDLDAPALTLPATMGGNRTPIVDQESLESGVEQWVVDYHWVLSAGRAPGGEVPDRLRRLTVEEAAALQTFPTWWPWFGSRSSIFRQIGNAVPPRLGYAVALSVVETLRSSRRSEPDT